jgi:hypothetical protein
VDYLALRSDFLFLATLVFFSGIVKSLYLCCYNENRRIQEEHEQEMAELQKSWLALRHLLRHIYDSESNARSNTSDRKTSEQTDDEISKIKELVER